MARLKLPWVTMLLSTLLVSCASVRDRTGVITEPRLDRANYRVLATNVRGADSGFRILFFPIMRASEADAIDRVRAKAPGMGRATRFINVKKEKRGRNFVFFGLQRFVVRADVIEFLPEEAKCRTADNRASPPSRRRQSRR